MGEKSRLTRNQALVFDTLSRAGAPLGAYAVLDSLRNEGLRAPLQIYRALEKLQALGLVHRVESLNAFVACPHPHDHKNGLVAFAICDRCGKVEEFNDEIVEDRLDRWGRKHGFTAQRTVIEISGTCGGCAAQ